MEERVLALIRERKKMLIPTLMLVFLFYFMLPLSLTLLPDLMNRTSFIPGLTWAWVYAFMQIPMTWLVGWGYHVNAKKLEEKINGIKREELK
ncbi:DUF485 domain-containing protein [Ornithinibacillus scapharcae]|uniref:DUF485 domain-containing protein n=1 Tax=Ornithinibacillus scapharcae TaxID=1147159 RepID=UPI000225B2C7|nr:DUF485 domain-containing protein [Ornithinibacillus scapharcae]